MHCTIAKQSNLAKLLQETSLIIWDEAPMINKVAPEALDRSLKEVMGNSKPFGGIVVVFGGDFRQVLPVIPKGSRAQVVNAA